MSRTEVPNRIRCLCSDFDSYVAAFDRHPPFNAGQLAIHQRVIALRRQNSAVRNERSRAMSFCSNCANY
jgi:hypothetical protein